MGLHGFRHTAPIIAVAVALALMAPERAHAQALEKLSMVIFSPPSLGAFMPPVIKAKKIDEAHGLDIAFQERTPDAYTAQFNSGEFKVGGSASLLQVGLGDIRGVKLKYLFNLFDFWGAVVTSRPEVKTLKDLEGKQLAGARSTTNYVMFEFFAKRLGVDIAKFQVVNTAPPGPRQLRARRPRRRDPAVGARLYAADGQEAEHPHARPQDG